MLFPLIAAAGCLLPAQVSEAEGTIGGIVVKAADQSPVAGAEVVLRQFIDGSLVVVAESKSEPDGKYLFRKLPLDGEIYQVGANHDGIHYPGEKVRLSRRQPVAGVKIEVCDAVAEPNPLVVWEHEVYVEPTEGKLKVREVLQIDNPGTTTYVGKSPDGKGEPVTLELSIPSDFARVTFDKEFYGRRFWVRGGKLATSIPWTPGVRELGFTYLLGNEKQHYTWERTADLPTSRIRIVARTEDPAAVTCNTGMRTTAEKGQVVYSVDEALPAGRVIRLDLGRLPLPIMAYARWAALLFLVASVGVSWAVFRRRRAKASLGSPAGTVAPGKTPHQKRRAGRAAKR